MFKAVLANFANDPKLALVIMGNCVAISLCLCYARYISPRNSSTYFAVLQGETTSTRNRLFDFCSQGLAYQETPEYGAGCQVGAD